MKDLTEAKRERERQRKSKIKINRQGSGEDKCERAGEGLKGGLAVPNSVVK